MTANEHPTARAEKKRKYVIKWWHGGVTEASGTSAVDAVRTAFDPSQVKHVRRKRSIARGKTLVQITWTDDTGDQVDVHLMPDSYPKHALAESMGVEVAYRPPHERDFPTDCYSVFLQGGQWVASRRDIEVLIGELEQALDATKDLP